jgi:hypothetical protein
MSNEIPNIIVIIFFLTTIATTITIFDYQMTSAVDDDYKSILPNYREGYEVGKVQGSKDNISDNEHDDRCPSWDRNILYCIGYEIGYNDGYYGTSNTKNNMTRE